MGFVQAISLPGRNLARYATHVRCPNRMAFSEFIMYTKSFAIRPSLLVMSAGFVLFAFGDRSLSQDAVQKEIELRQIQKIPHPELHDPEGPFAEDRKRIAALTDAAERITQAGMPDVAHGLRERAEQLERELAEKQERMQQEERKRIESAMRERQEHARQQPQPHQPQRLMEQRLMEQRREGIERGDQPTAPLRELHEQLEQIRRDMHKLSEQMTDLTRLIQQHHNPRNDRSHHEEDSHEEDGREEDSDEEDSDEEDGHEEDGEDGH